MKKLFISGVVLSGIVFFSCQVKTDKSQDIKEIKRGEQVYKNVCSSCHWKTVKPEEIKNIKKVVMSGGRPPFNAPPMAEVSARVKKFYPTEEKFVAFVKDYITNPSRKKGVCMPMAFKVFGVMPPIGRNLTEQDKEAVAKWLYHSFNVTWEEFMKKNPH